MSIQNRRFACLSIVLTLVCLITGCGGTKDISNDSGPAEISGTDSMASQYEAETEQSDMGDGNTTTVSVAGSDTASFRPSGSSGSQQPASRSDNSVAAAQSSRSPAPGEPLVQNNSILFDAPKSNLYNYCPSIMETNSSTRYIYYCTNRDSNRILDYIGCRKGTKTADGWVWGQEALVLSPSPGKWDREHNCDHSVVAGTFNYNGEGYGYLMAYLGCATTNSQENATGLAVAKDPMGPWVKLGSNPIIPFVRDTSPGAVDRFQWGNGQASLVSIDKAGRVMMFYSYGNALTMGVIAERWNFSNLNAPVKEFSNTVTVRGLTDLNGQPDFFNNADFCYSPAQKRFYAASDCHPNPASQPDFISGAFRLNSISDAESAVTGDVFRYITGQPWRLTETAGVNETGWPRNHNVGIVTDPYGWTLSDSIMEVVYTKAPEGADSLWGYRLCTYRVQID